MYWASSRSSITVKTHSLLQKQLRRCLNETRRQSSAIEVSPRRPSSTMRTCLRAWRATRPRRSLTHCTDGSVVRRSRASVVPLLLSCTRLAPQPSQGSATTRLDWYHPFAADCLPAGVMRTSKSTPVSSEGVVRDIRRHNGAEEKIRIVLDGLRGETSIAELCRRVSFRQRLSCF